MVKLLSANLQLLLPNVDYRLTKLDFWLSLRVFIVIVSTVEDLHVCNAFLYAGRSKVRGRQQKAVYSWLQ